MSEGGRASAIANVRRRGSGSGLSHSCDFNRRNGFVACFSGKYLFQMNIFRTKNARFRGKVNPMKYGRAKNPCGTLDYEDCTGYRHNQT